MNVKDIKYRFMYHKPPDQHVSALHEKVRNRLWEVADFIAMHTPIGREQSLAITKLEEAMMWANAAIARNPYFMTKEGKDEKV